MLQTYFFYLLWFAALYSTLSGLHDQNGKWTHTYRAFQPQQALTALYAISHIHTAYAISHIHGVLLSTFLHISIYE